MKYTRFFLLLLILALILCACGESSGVPYVYDSSEGLFEVDPVKCTITNGRDVYSYSVRGKIGDNADYRFTYPNGATWQISVSKSNGVSTYGGSWDGYIDESRYAAATTLLAAVESGAPREKIGDPLAGLMMLFFGFVCFCFPTLPFHLRYGWAVQDAEPTEGFLLVTRTCSILAIILGILFSFL